VRPSARHRPRPEVIYLVAPCGNPNYGDEFVVRAWLRHLARIRPHADVVVDCHTPGQAAVLLQRQHPRVVFVDTVWRMCFETAGLPAADAAAVAADVIANPGRMPRIVSGVELLTRADTVHLVGGGYINTIWPHHLALVAAAGAAAARSGGRAVATGQGLVPVGDPDRLSLLRRLLSAFAVVDVRDEPSFAALGGSPGRGTFTGDDAWLGVGDPGVYDTESPAARRDFLFCLQADLMEDFGGGAGLDGLTASIGGLIARWDVAGERAAFVEGIPGQDRIVFDRLSAMLPGVEFVPFVDVWARGLPARPGQTWVSTRFHCHLLAAAAGASGVALSGRADYYPVKHRSLVDDGSRWHVADSADLPHTPSHRGGFDPVTVKSMNREKRALADEIYPRRRLGTARGIRTNGAIRGADSTESPV
jgi:hypothetical protein